MLSELYLCFYQVCLSIDGRSSQSKTLESMFLLIIPTLIVLRSRHGPLCPLDLTTKSPVATAADNTGQMTAAPCNISSSSTLVTSFRAGHSFAHKMTDVPLRRSALTKGRTPRTISTPLLSTNIAAQWCTVFCKKYGLNRY